MNEKTYDRSFFKLPLSLNIVSYQVKGSRFVNLRLLTDLTSEACINLYWEVNKSSWI